MNIVRKMNQSSQIAVSARSLSGACALSAMVVAGTMLTSASSQAQDEFQQRQSVFIDGSTPVDPRTRARVDAYFDEIENRQEAKAEERKRFDRFIYHDNSFGSRQFGRW